MTPISAASPERKPARTGIGWLIQTCTRFTPAHATTDLLFPAAERHPTIETFTASCLVAIWSLAAFITLALHSTILPPSLPLRSLIAILTWITLIHSAVFLPLLAYPLFRSSPQKIASLTEFTFLLLLTLIAYHLSTLTSPFAQTLGLLWLGLFLFEAGLRLARSGIALASRSH